MGGEGGGIGDLGPGKRPSAPREARALLSGPGGQPCASAWLLGAALERWVGRVGWLLRMRRHLRRG